MPVASPYTEFARDVRTGLMRAPQKTLPCRYWFTQKLRFLDRDLLQALLQATGAALQQEIPGLGEVVAFDVKHISAWVKENNPRVYIKDRYDKDQILCGDPHCKLGVKKSSNQHASQAPDPPKQPAVPPAEPSSKASRRRKKPRSDQQPQEPSSKATKECLWGYGSGVAAATDPVYGNVVLAEYTLPRE